jgi:hypothetical protein
MEIYILHDGKELGPFNEETTQSMLKRGEVLISELAWKPGMAEWIPLHSVLYPAPAATGQRPPPPPRGAVSEPAGARQKAFLSYMGIAFEPEITRDAAALLVNDALENPKDPGRLMKWNEDRLRLHPIFSPPRSRRRRRTGLTISSSKRKRPARSASRR